MNSKKEERKKQTTFFKLSGCKYPSALDWQNDIIQYGHVKWKCALKHACAQYTDSNRPSHAHAQSIIRAFALHSYIL